MLLHGQESWKIMFLPPAKPHPVFGQSGLPPAPVPSPAFAAAWGPVPASTATLVARYNWKVGLIGAILLFVSCKFALTLMLSGNLAEILADASLRTRETMIPILLAPCSAVLGLIWLGRFRARAPALTLDSTGVTGFTLFGTRHIDWQDVESVSFKNHKAYKMQIVIRAIAGSRTGGWGGIGIPVWLGGVNQTQESIVNAIRCFRPDLPVALPRKAPLIVQLFRWYSSRGSQ